MPAEPNNTHHVVLFYLYKELESPESLRSDFKAMCNANDVTGRLLLSKEGVNGNLGTRSKEKMDALLSFIETHPTLGGQHIDYKMDVSMHKPFPDLRIEVVKEIVATGNAMPLSLLTEKKLGGKHLTPKQFHETLASYFECTGTEDPNKKPLYLIDVRNRKEIKFGHFKNAVDSNTKMFSEWAVHFAAKRAEEMKNSKVLMYCTGGVRCEKASAYLKSLGVEDVDQLQGGIHRYLEEYGAGGYFVGSNFVFDSRGLQKPRGAETIARCFHCHGLNEQLSSDRVCAVCRDSIVVCDACRIKFKGAYYCDAHKELQGVYFYFLEDLFTFEELKQQAQELKKLCLPGGAYFGVAFRNRRRSIRKQLDRIAGILNNPEEEWVVERKLKSQSRCRSCGLPSRALMSMLAQKMHTRDSTKAEDSVEEYCDGNCFGFFMPERRKKGYINLLAKQTDGEGT